MEDASDAGGMMRLKDSPERLDMCAYIAIIILQLVIYGAIGYTITHFVSKYW